MINLDLTKMLHPRIWDVLPAFLPGVCFEITVFLANPEVFQTYASHAHLDRYSEIGVAVVGAFVLGAAFMCWTTLLHSLLFWLHKLTSYLWPKLLTYLLQARGPKPSWFSRRQFVSRAYYKAMSESHSRVRGAQRAWRRAAVQLLQQRYGIELASFPDNPDQGEWYVWSGALGTRPEPIRGMLFITAIHATGWSGLAAGYCTPLSLLRSRLYLAVPLFLIGYSLLQVWTLTKWWNNRTTQWMLSLRRVLADIPSAPLPAGVKATGVELKIEE
jgi:hypothetical protein